MSADYCGECYPKILKGETVEVGRCLECEEDACQHFLGLDGKCSNCTDDEEP